MAERTVAVVGLGNIGSSIGMLLVRGGFEVTGFDVREDAVRELEENGGRPAPDPGTAAANADVVVTCLPSEQALGNVLDALVPHLHGKTLIETSTLALTAKQDAYDRVVAAGGHIVDSPLSGTAMQARDGDVIAYTSADEGVTDEVRDVLDGFTRAWYPMNPFGTATKMKLVANLLVAVHNVAAAEALVLAQKAGLDLNHAVEVLADGAGSSRMLQVRGPMMANGTYDQPGMNNRVFMKDVSIITEFARDLDVPIPLLASTAPIYSSAIAHGWSDADTASVYTVLANLAGIDPVPATEESR